MNKDRLLQKMEVMVNACKSFASLSHDPKHKVGALIFSRDFDSIPSWGYNGNYSGGPNERDSMESGKSGFIHAEVNALFKMNIPKKDRDDYAMIVTLSPCDMCAKSINQNGIKKVFILNLHTEPQSYPVIFNSVGTQYCLLDPDPSKWDVNRIAEVLEIELT
jgi:dCMP deaminase